MNLENLFTNEDLILLDKAIDALPRIGFSSMMMTEILFAGLGNEKDKEDRLRDRDARIEKQEIESKKIEESCIELKFKLLQLKKIINN